MTIFVKDPDAKLDYGFDWSDWLQSGEEISTSSWSVSPSGLVLSGGANTTSSTTTWVEGGIAGSTYTMTNEIETNSGRKDDRSMTIQVKDR